MVVTLTLIYITYEFGFYINKNSQEHTFLNGFNESWLQSNSDFCIIQRFQVIS